MVQIHTRRWRRDRSAPSSDVRIDKVPYLFTASVLNLDDPKVLLDLAAAVALELESFHLQMDALRRSAP